MSVIMLGALSVLEKKLRFQVAFVLTVIPRLPDRYRIVRPADGARIVEFSDRELREDIGINRACKLDPAIDRRPSTNRFPWP